MRRRVDPTSEEDSYDDVLCVLELLSHLVTKDLVDESDEPPGEKVLTCEIEWFGHYARDLISHPLESVCVCVCIYYVEHNRAIRPRHPSHYMNNLLDSIRFCIPPPTVGVLLM